MKKILFYGDSNTYGYDPVNPLGGRYPEEIRWPDRLAEQLEGRLVIRANGMNGRQVPAMEFELEYFEASVEEQLPLDYIAVMLGTNDILFGERKDVYGIEAAMRKLVERTRRFEASLILIAPVLIKSTGQKDPYYRFHQLSKDYAECLRSIAEEEGLLFINAAEWKVDLAYDRVHFSERGCIEFADAMAEELIRLGIA